MKSSSPLRAGIIGCGGISGAHAKAIIENPQAITLAACADIAIDKARALAEQCGSGNAYDDYEKMLDTEKLDLVIIATWPNLHEEQVTAAAKRGVRMILCEKSLAMTAASASRMAEAAKQGGSILVEGFMGRHHPRTLELEKLVREGRIGPLRKIRAGFQRPAMKKPSWKSNPMFGGVVFDFTCYCVNAIGQFTTQLPDAVYARKIQQDDGLIIQMDGMLHYADGLVAFVESSYTLAFQQPLDLHGETGILRMQNAWTGSGQSGIDLEPNRNPTVTEHIETPVADRGVCQLLHLCECLKAGALPRFTIEESIRNHIVIDALMQSAEIGQPVSPQVMEVA